MAKDTEELAKGLKKFGKNDLNEVRADAQFNYLKQLKKQRDDAEYREAKAAGSEGVRELAEKGLEEFKTKPATKK